MIKKTVIFLALLAGVVALAISSGGVDEVVEWRVEAALVDAGVSEERAQCMAARMVDRLSIGQLRKLQSAMTPRDGESEKPRNLRDFLRRVGRIDDAEVIAVTGSSAGLCAIGIG